MTRPLEPDRPEPDVAEVVGERFGDVETAAAELDATDAQNAAEASYVRDMADGVD